MSPHHFDSVLLAPLRSTATTVPASEPSSGMINEGNPVAAWRDAQIGDVSPRLVEHFPDRKLDALGVFQHPNHGEIGTVGQPVGPH